MDDAIEKRLSELVRRSYAQGCYCFTNFLDLQALSVWERIRPALPPVKATLFGGLEGCERKILRLGDESACGYDVPFPIRCIRAVPLNKKFADPLTHRDFLGALMALGIERELLGDIIIRDAEAYLFCVDRIAPYLTENFMQARHTSLRCEVVEAPPAGELFRTEKRVVQLSSERVDALIAHVYRLSRSDAQALIPAEKVFVNGRQCQSAGYTPKPGEIVSVRGFGRMRYIGAESVSKKGKYNVAVEIYI